MKKIFKILSSALGFFLVSFLVYAAVGKVIAPNVNQTAQSIGGSSIVDSTMIPTKSTADGSLFVSSESRPIVSTTRSMDAFSTVGVGVPVDVSGAKDVYAMVYCSTVGCDKQILFSASWREDPLLSQNDFLGSAGTLDDPWDYVSFYDISDPSTLIVGDTGVNFTGQNVRVFLLNIDGAVQVTPRVVTNSVAGNVTVDITHFIGN